MTYQSRAVNRLREGKHPVDGTMLCTLPRRITRLDVGLDIWNGECMPCMGVYCENADRDLACVGHEDTSIGQFGSCDTLPLQQLMELVGDEEDPAHSLVLT